MSGARRFLRQVAILAAKDVKVFLLDRGSLLFALAFPFVFVFVVMFSLVMGRTLAPEDRPVVIHLATAEPEGSISRQIIEGMAASAQGLRARRLEPEEARRALLGQEIGGYLFFPGGFSEALERGEPTRLTVFYHPESVTARAALASVARAIATEIRSYQVMYRAIGELAGTPALPGPGIPLRAGWGPGDGAASEELGLRVVVEQVGEIESGRPVDFLVPWHIEQWN